MTDRLPVAPSRPVVPIAGLLSAEIDLAPPVTARKGSLPVLPGFAREILPALAAWWVVILVLLFTHKAYWLDLGLVGTPTIVMLWPVGHSLGLRYFGYRRAAWLIAIVTMWIIPATGLVFTESDSSFTTRSALFFALPAVIAFGGILVSLPWAQARTPPRMFFRPDLLFGDGRTLVGGTLMIVLGLRYLFAPHPADVQWALPQWDWYSLAYGISGAIIPLVLMRGMVKLVQRQMRLRDGLFTGYPSIAFRELFLVLLALNFGFAFHHVFLGRVVFATVDDPGFYPVNTRFWVGLGLMVTAVVWMVFVKGGFKRLIGEPFFFETFAQTLQKQIVFVAAWGAFFYGYMSMLSSTMFGRPQPGGDPQTLVGAGFLGAGVVVLTFGRAIAQHYQREGMLAHFAGVLLPTQADRARERMMLRILAGLAQLPPRQARRAWRVMHRAWDGIDPDERSLMAWTTLNALAGLEPGQRESLIRSRADALSSLDEEMRSRAVNEMARALSGLDPGRKEEMARELAPVIASA